MLRKSRSVRKLIFLTNLNNWYIIENYLLLIQLLADIAVINSNLIKVTSTNLPTTIKCGFLNVSKVFTEYKKSDFKVHISWCCYLYIQSFKVNKLRSKH